MKYKLNEVLMEDEFFEETSMIGIVSALPPYRLCWVLNGLFDIDFVCETDMTINLSLKGGEIASLPVYQYQYPNSANRYLLYKLKVENTSLLPEINKMDYIWLVQTGTHDEDVLEIAAALKRSPDIILSQILERSQLKNLKNLLI